MLKVIGCTLILAGMTGYGVSSVCYMKRHLEELVEYKEILYALLGEIQHYRKPLAEAFDTIAKKRSEGYRQVLEMIAARMKKFEEAKGSEIWEDSFLSCSRKFLFSREEEEIIQKAGIFWMRRIWNRRNGNWSCMRRRSTTGSQRYKKRSAEKEKFVCMAACWAGCF